MIEYNAFLVNLPERGDRLSKSIDELQNFGIIKNLMIYPAIKTENGVIGCAFSHLNILGISSNEKENKHVLIFEDDVKFLPNARENFELALKDLEEVEWDMFYLGGNICNTITPVTKHLGKLSHAQSTHAYMVNKNFISRLLLEIPRYYATPLDLIYTSIIPTINAFISIPEMIAVQRPSYSDIEKRDVEYESWMIDRYKSHLKLPLDK
ncbi:MAG: hypothetical protein KatS3mg002_1016 [Candidatus Woesearchaeota archaeon]|jgi:GR25 family glycosyltransferase involved in LPS biosynthesis|nr:MAG: hypothetical protein KatS3mg002_1016 [Candidatus Woesearchaeota archaeon]